jgi:hypothetical protein
LSPGLDNSTELDRKLDSYSTGYSTGYLDSYSTDLDRPRQLLDRTPLTPCDGGVKCQARQLDSSTDLTDLDKP